jgi:hypothetical protein
MLPRYHILLGFVFSFILFLIFPNIKLIEAGIIFLSSFLIDVDHYIYYTLNNKDISLKNAINYFLGKRKRLSKISIKKRNKYYSMFCFLHGIEVLLVLFILGLFISKYFLLILIGFTFHLCLDLIEEINNNLRLDKISVIYDLIKFRKLKLFK